MTLKANQLRIGNWFIQYDEPEQFDGDFYHLSDIKFIPLTEEWLLKFGFERTDQKDNSNDDWTWLFYQKDSIYIDGSDLTIETASGIVIKLEYVHQLQNLYFALTRDELTLKNNLK